jgi:hypothetical protein
MGQKHIKIAEKHTNNAIKNMHNLSIISNPTPCWSINKSNKHIPLITDLALKEKERDIEVSVFVFGTSLTQGVHG